MVSRSQTQWINFSLHTNKCLAIASKKEEDRYSTGESCELRGWVWQMYKRWFWDPVYLIPDKVQMVTGGAVLAWVDRDRQPLPEPADGEPRHRDQDRVPGEPRALPRCRLPLHRPRLPPGENMRIKYNGNVAKVFWYLFQFYWMILPWNSPVVSTVYIFSVSIRFRLVKYGWQHGIDFMFIQGVRNPPTYTSSQSVQHTSN